MMKKVRWGIVSTGGIATKFAQDILQTDNASLAAVGSRNQDSADKFAAAHQVPSAYDSYEGLFADDSVDAIYVATPHPIHLPNSADALRAGKAVLCEKPITTSAAELQELIDVAVANNGFLAEAMWTWFLPAVQQAKAWLDSGRIGKLRHVRAELGYPVKYRPDSRMFDPELAGGCLLDMGVYPIAIARYFTGRSPQEIQVLSRRAQNGVEDDIAMQFNYDDCVASLAATFRCKLPNTTYLIGSEGHIEMPLGWGASDAHLYVAEDLVESYNDQRRGSGLEFEIQSVSEDILQGKKQSETVPLSASLDFQKHMDQVRAQL
jgi:predicted dehydrogenase